MDLRIRKHLSWRWFEADYVWARHNYSDFAAPQFPDLRRPCLKAFACAPDLSSIGAVRRR